MKLVKWTKEIIIGSSKYDLRFAAVSALVIMLTGCWSSDSSEKDLDIGLEVVSNDNSSLGKPKNGMSSKGGTQVISVASVIRWQNFFKTPPTVHDRKEIEKKLMGWENSSSIKDLIKKGRNEVALGRFSRAEASFREALRKDGENLDSLLELAMLYLRRKDLGRSFEFLSQLRDGINLTEDPSPSFVFRYRYTLALAYIARGDRDEGHRVLSDLIGLDKAFTPGYAALASSYAKEGKLKVAKFIAMRGLDRGKEDPALCNVLGVIAQKMGLFEEAEKWYNKAYSLAPTFAPALVNRANLQIKRFDYDAAEDDLIRALMYEPHNVNALISLGIVHKKTGKFTASRSVLTKALDLDPENAIARFNLAVLMVDSLDKPNEAIRLFYEVVQTAKSNRNLRDIAKNYINNIKGNREAY